MAHKHFFPVHHHVRSGLSRLDDVELELAAVGLPLLYDRVSYTHKEKHANGRTQQTHEVQLLGPNPHFEERLVGL